MNDEDDSWQDRPLTPAEVADWQPLARMLEGLLGYDDDGPDIGGEG